MKEVFSRLFSGWLLFTAGFLAQVKVMSDWTHLGAVQGAVIIGLAYGAMATLVVWKLVPDVHPGLTIGDMASPVVTVPRPFLAVALPFLAGLLSVATVLLILGDKAVEASYAAPLPKPGAMLMAVFLWEFVFSGLLYLASRLKAGPLNGALLIGATLALGVIIVALAVGTGAINPARAFGPLLFLGSPLTLMFALLVATILGPLTASLLIGKRLPA